jgi:hypothetical protein
MQPIIDATVEGTMLKRAATLEDVGNAAVFAASDWARTMTATALNITCGAVPDEPSLPARTRTTTSRPVPAAGRSSIDPPSASRSWRTIARPKPKPSASRSPR